MKKTLLMIGAGPEQTLGILKAQKMGLRVLATDADRDAVGLKVADDFEIASTFDIDASTRASEILNKRYKINYVMTLGIDTPLVVAKIAEKFGLPGLSVQTAFLALNKYEMKKQFLKYNIPIPWFAKLDSVKNLKTIVGERGFPLIIKPVDSRGARGVIRLTSDIDLKWAYEKSLSHSPTKQVMVEEHLIGPQFSTESIIWDNFATTPAITRRNYPFLKKYKPYIIEDGDDLPPGLNKTEEASIKLLAEKGARAVGINRWTAKGDLVLTKDGPKIIEIAARMSGGQLATVKTQYNTGVDFLRAAILLAMGQKPDFSELVPKYNHPVSQRYFFVRSGKLKKISGVEKLANKKWIVFSKIWVKPGDTIPEMVHMSARSGNVITLGTTLKQAINRAKKAVKMVNFEIDE